MSIFNSLFGNSEETQKIKSNINWIPLTNLGQLNEIMMLSEVNPVLIFKHSTRSSVSRMALKQFENEFDLADTVDAYFLDLLEYRNISNEIANRFQVQHQSPQLILIKEGKAFYNASHSAIDAVELKGKL